MLPHAFHAAAIAALAMGVLVIALVLANEGSSTTIQCRGERNDHSLCTIVERRFFLGSTHTLAVDGLREIQSSSTLFGRFQLKTTHGVVVASSRQLLLKTRLSSLPGTTSACGVIGGSGFAKTDRADSGLGLAAFVAAFVVWTRRRSVIAAQNDELQVGVELLGAQRTLHRWSAPDIMDVSVGATERRDTARITVRFSHGEEHAFVRANPKDVHRALAVALTALGLASPRMSG